MYIGGWKLKEHRSAHLSGCDPVFCTNGAQVSARNRPNALNRADAPPTVRKTWLSFSLMARALSLRHPAAGGDERWLADRSRPVSRQPMAARGPNHYAWGQSRPMAASRGSVLWIAGFHSQFGFCFFFNLYSRDVFVKGPATCFEQQTQNTLLLRDSKCRLKIKVQ